MNAHRRMKNYMERHKIGSLFEELMAKLVSEMPSDPVPFLIKLLQQKLFEVRPQTVMTVAQLRRSLGDLTKPLEVEKAHVHIKPTGSTLSRQRPSSVSTTASPRHAVTFYPSQPSTLAIDRRKSLQLGKSRLDRIRSSSPGPRQLVLSKAVQCEDIDKHDTRVQHNPTSEVAQPRYVLPGEVFDHDPLKDEIIQLKVLSDFDDEETPRSAGKAYQSNKTPDLKEPSRTGLKNEKPKMRRFDQEPEIEMFENPEELAEEGIFVCKANNLKIYKFAQPMKHNGACWYFTICPTCAKVVKRSDSPTNGACMTENDKQYKNTSVRFEERRFKADRNHMEKPTLSPPCYAAYNNKHESHDRTGQVERSMFRHAQDSRRSTSQEDIFNDTPRSLPLPATPTSQHGIDWCFPSVEFLKAGSSGWANVHRDRSEPDSP